MIKVQRYISEFIAGSCMLLAIFFSACSSDENVQEDVKLSSATDLSGLSAAGGEYELDVKASGTWTLVLPVADQQWCEVSPLQGTDDGKLKAVVAANTGSLRTTLLSLRCGTGLDTLRIIQQSGGGKIVPGRLEIPRLTEDPGCLFIDHRVNYRGKMVNNYCMEYQLEKRHARWVAFTAYDVTATDAVTRTDAWADDPELPAAYRTQKEDYNGNGYDRGHLVASNDRRYCKEANEQTFYYSNMSPQLGDFNQKIWQKLEENVKSWMQNAALRDTLYVVKGGTIDDAQIWKYAGKVAVPKYYYMAVLALKNGSYKSIAFWLEHKAYTEPYDLKGKALSVDELEAKTGIDFFPLLPDDVEKKVEAVYQLNDWTWKNK